MAMSTNPSLLIVDDDIAFVRAAAEIARSASYDVTVADCVRQGTLRLERSHFDLALIDLTLPDGSGLDLIEHFDLARTRVVLATGHPTVESALRALRMPVLGDLRQKIILARFSTFFAMLYRAGISVLDCIQICEKIVGNRVMEEGLQRVGRSISEGQGISQAFLATKLFPPLVLRMLRVGESTGGLDVALLNVSYFYNRQVRESISRMQQLLGPATTVVLGGLVVAILYAIFLPIYDVIAKIQF